MAGWAPLAPGRVAYLFSPPSTVACARGFTAIKIAPSSSPAAQLVLCLLFALIALSAGIGAKPMIRIVRGLSPFLYSAHLKKKKNHL